VTEADRGEELSPRAVPQNSPTEAGLAAVAAERRRQIEVEDWTPEHDDEHDNGEMAAAAAAYAFSAYTNTAARYFAAEPVGFWPWDACWWKPRTPREDLVRAGALIVAEIERIDRAAAAEGRTNG
jgi:hypothetical protein